MIVGITDKMDEVWYIERSKYIWHFGGKDETFNRRKIKKARKDAKIRQDAAAEKMEMSRPTLSAIEADKRLVWAEEITKFAEMY